MPRSGSCRLGLVALMIGLLAACGGDDRDSCAPTDSTCAPPSSTPLAVAQVSPADGANHVDAAATVTITFSRPVQPATVTTAAITVGSAAGTISVSGATVTFIPAAPLADGAAYQVRVSGVRAVDGAGMTAAFTSSFTTRLKPVCTECPATAITRADIEAQGTVVQTAEGFTVDGSLSVRTGESRRITFLGANVDVRFDANGRLRSMSGKVQIP